VKNDPRFPKLRGVLNRVTMAKEGERNAIVFWAACRLLEFGAEGFLGQSYAEECLIRAASDAGLHPAETRTAFASAVKHGGSGHG
jgi:hypothetical protein